MQKITEKEIEKMLRQISHDFQASIVVSSGTGVHKWKIKFYDVRNWRQIQIGNDTVGAKDQRHSKNTIIDNVDANICHRTSTLTFDLDIAGELDIADDLDL